MFTIDPKNVHYKTFSHLDTTQAGVVYPVEWILEAENGYDRGGITAFYGKDTLRRLFYPTVY